MRQSGALGEGACNCNQCSKLFVNSTSCSHINKQLKPAMHSRCRLPQSSPSWHCTCGNTLSIAAPRLQLLKRLCRGMVVSADHFRLHNAQWLVFIRSSSGSGSFGFTLPATMFLRLSWWTKSSEETLQPECHHKA